MLNSISSPISSSVGMMETKADSKKFVTVDLQPDPVVFGALLDSLASIEGALSEVDLTIYFRFYRYRSKADASDDARPYLGPIGKGINVPANEAKKYLENCFPTNNKG